MDCDSSWVCSSLLHTWKLLSHCLPFCGQSLSFLGMETVQSFGKCTYLLWEVRYGHSLLCVYLPKDTILFWICLFIALSNVIIVNIMKLILFLVLLYLGCNVRVSNGSGVELHWGGQIYLCFKWFSPGPPALLPCCSAHAAAYHQPSCQVSGKLVTTQCFVNNLIKSWLSFWIYWTFYQFQLVLVLSFSSPITHTKYLVNIEYSQITMMLC